MHPAIRIAPAALAALVWTGPAPAQVFEVIHPDVVKGGFEVEVLNGVVLDDIARGEERSVHEIAIGYSPFSFWKTTGAIEIANPRGEAAELEAFEWENVFLLPLGGDPHGHGHDHSHGHDAGGLTLGAVGVYLALEVPNEGGIGAGGLEIGPVAEFGVGPVEMVANLFLDIPFEDGADPGLAYALSAAVPVDAADRISVGAEAHGGAEGAFGDALPLGETTHVLGPAVYADVDIGRGRSLEPRFALLFGLTEGSPDAVASFNIELKF